MDHQAFAQLLGNYGEFVGAIAILITLVYVAYQIRQSRALLLSNAYQARTDAVTSIYLAMAQDASLINLLGRANSGEVLRGRSCSSHVYLRFPCGL